MHKLILASQSPRRLELLQNAGFKIHTHPVKVSETLDKTLNLPSAIEAIALTKARAGADECKSLKGQKYLILAGDTLVAYNNQVLGKPKDRNHAIWMLQTLSGGVHQVITGLAWVELDSGREVTASMITEVTFRALSLPEIETYVDGGEPMDKAGAYGIQGKAKEFVTNVSGSWSNVVGWPMELFLDLLNRYQIEAERL